MKSSKKQCCKCKTELPTVLIRQAYYCQTCFHYVFIGKYRSVLLRLRNSDRVNGKVLLACSGGPSSVAMLSLTKNFMRVVPTEKKKVQLIPEAIVCHIDESTLFENNSGSAEKLGQHMKEHFPGFEYISHRIEDVFEQDFRKNANFDKVLKSTSGGVENNKYEHFVEFSDNDSVNPKEKLKTLFSSIKNTTAKEDLLWNMKMEMLVTVARREGCSYIFMGDSATRQAIKMISMTGKGRGYSIALDVSVDDQISFKDLCIMRPMKDMLAKEIGLYNYFTKNGQFVVAPFNFGTMLPGKSSIDRLTEEFVISIEREFSSTVSTICRTAAKLTPSENMDINNKCAICLMPFEYGVGEWRKHITVTNVKGTEESLQDSCSNGGECCGSNGGCSSNTPTVDLNKSLCYSCQVNLKDYNQTSIENLPLYVSENVYERSRDSRLLDQIKDFLIDDDEE